MKPYWSWLGWIAVSATLSLYLALGLTGTDPEAGVSRAMFLPGATTSGHHQIELACDSCHTSPLGGTEVLQQACEGCHLEELAQIRDSHPRRKFTDPANVATVAKLDARICVTCHREHQAETTAAMGLTVPEDVCFLCHEKVGEERPTHAGLGFDTCGSSGCHNFHDNTALYETFLVDNAHMPAVASSPLVAPLNALERAVLAKADPDSVPAADAPPARLADNAHAQWQGSAHALAEVNCSDCHQAGEDDAWQAKPGLEICESCHAGQAGGFRLGKHGMRLAAGLGAMSPALARAPMKATASHQELGCTSCHGSHDFDLQRAAIDACVGCHDSTHTRAYENSPHHVLSLNAFAGAAPMESAVTCATCHMPRESVLSGGVKVTHVQHNQNLNLRPSDKMLRSVCMNCHSLAFAIDALADPALVASNFKGASAVHVESIDMAIGRRAPEGAGSVPAPVPSLGERQ